MLSFDVDGTVLPCMRYSSIAISSQPLYRIGDTDSGIARRGDDRRRLEELRDILDAAARTERLGVCVDTCHVSDAGYDILGDLDGFLAEFDRVIGLSRMRALHLNDSKNLPGSRKDRHACLGEGTLGLETFRRIVNHPALRGLPMVLETPNELPGYAAEIAMLRGFSE